MPTEPNDLLLVAALRRGDEAAFGSLIDRYHASLIRIATLFVRDYGVAEEVAQETWIGVLKGLDRFEGRSSFRTWLFSILANQARRRGERERRMIPFSALARPANGGAEAAVDPERFIPPGEVFAGYWATPPRELVDDPETVLLSAEARAAIDQAITALPPNQQAVIHLRDVEGWEADEVCNTLGLSATNQRVLLHRARSRVRQALAPYLEVSDDVQQVRDRDTVERH
ncbi:MAG: RNA polymerase sigma factor [Thermomicrobiales bacterium]